MSFLIIYLFSSWVPTLLGSIGVELSKASWITASCILVLYMFSLAKQKRARQGTTMNATPANAS